MKKSTTLAKFTTSKGNKIEIYTTPILGKNSCIVFDESCLLERVYTIGKNAFLNWEQFEKGYEPVKNIQQVIDAWKNEEIHF